MLYFEMAESKRLLYERETTITRYLFLIIRDKEKTKTCPVQ